MAVKGDGQFDGVNSTYVPSTQAQVAYILSECARASCTMIRPWPDTRGESFVPIVLQAQVEYTSALKMLIRESLAAYLAASLPI